ncbi:hypothetical protein FHW69_002259 [Luteibacter sp. Sphag1AF]|uniref:hypothetical protein n=1 Tax=Luteibacter sp. Sphag1AF TaxID=2587031 RepID=UPI0016145B54|nr:hypothetical protein [Luteibacter sp. Sphag1AF]MBB3227636.1 hypothetical protein [Luteibacter sp. Sphag1AF]
MIARQLLTVGFRLFAIWLCVAALQAFSLVASARTMISFLDDTPWSGLVFVGVFIVIAVIVWALSSPLSRVLTSGMQSIGNARISATDLVAVGCVLMGLWWLKEAILPLLALWGKAISLSEDGGKSAFALLGAEGKVSVSLYMLQIAIGAYFVTQPYKLATRLVRHVPVVSEPEAQG